MPSSAQQGGGGGYGFQGTMGFLTSQAGLPYPIALALVVMLRGSGAASVDRALSA